MDYSDRDLSNTSSRGKDLFGANFKNSILIDANFEASSLPEASFIHAHLANSNFTNANLESSNFFQANLNDTNLSKANIRGCNFSHASLINANLEYAETGISFVAIFNILYAAFEGATLNTVAITNGHSTVNSADNEIPNQSVGNLLAKAAISIVLTCIFSKFSFTTYQQHNLFSSATIIFVALFCFAYSIYSFIRVIKTLKKYSGSSFSNANLSGAKLNYALIADTDFTNAIITNVDWHNSKSKCDRDESI